MSPINFCAKVLLPWVTAGSLISGSTVLADVEMTQRLEGAQEGTIVTRFKTQGQKLVAVRADQSPEISLITDFKKKRVVALHHGQKLAVVTKFRKLDKEEKKREKGEAALRTGKEEKLGEAETIVFKGTLATGVGPADATYWVAKTDSREGLLVPLMHAYADSPVMKGTPGLSESLKVFPGVLLKSEVTVRDKSVITHLVSVEEKEVAGEVYEIPEDYKVKKQ